VRSLFIVALLIVSSIPKDAADAKDFVVAQATLNPPAGKLLGGMQVVPAPSVVPVPGGQKQDSPTVQPIQPPVSLPPRIELPKAPEPCVPGRIDCP
jgi:hypothetical protein